LLELYEYFWSADDNWRRLAFFVLFIHSFRTLLLHQSFVYQMNINPFSPRRHRYTEVKPSQYLAREKEAQEQIEVQDGRIFCMTNACHVNPMSP